MSLSLRTKILLSFSGLILLFGFGAAYYGRNALSRILENELNEKGSSLGKSLAVQSETLLVTDDAYSLYELFSSTLTSDSDVRYIFIESPSEVVRYHTFEKGIPMSLRQANEIDSNSQQSLRIISTNEGNVLDVATPMEKGKDGTLRLGLTFTRMQSLVTRYIYFLLLVLVLPTILALHICDFLARLINRPIAALSRVTNAVARGDLSLKVPEGRDEIGRFGTDFNIMTEKLSASRNELLQRNRELTILNGLHSDLLKKAITAQEEERKRIARELHDDIGQVLSEISVVLRDIEEEGHESVNLMQRVSKVKGETTFALQSLRETILNLRPTVLDDLGLIPALRWFAREKLEKLGLRFYFELKGVKRRLNPQIEITLFRVMQEAMNNIAKYAKAKVVSLRLELNNGRLIAEIRDDGIGFNVDEVLSSNDMKSLGLLGMKERLSLINGTLEVSSKQDQGTAIHIEIPDMKG